jgi:Zn-dependent alcohol dehydrogenase
MESGTLPVETIVSRRLLLCRIQEGLDLLRHGKENKVILEPED